MLLVLTAFAGTQRSVPAQKKRQAKDELAPIVSAIIHIGLSFTRGVVGVGAGVAGATRGLGPNGPTGPNGPIGPNGPTGPMVPVPYTPRQIKADSGSQVTFCAEGVPDAVRARLSKFTSIVRATARVANARRRDVRLGRNPEDARRDQEGLIRHIVSRRIAVPRCGPGRTVRPAKNKSNP